MVSLWNALWALSISIDTTREEVEVIVKFVVALKVKVKGSSPEFGIMVRADCPRKATNRHKPSQVVTALPPVLRGQPGLNPGSNDGTT